MTAELVPVHKLILNARQALLRGDRQAARRWAMRAASLDQDSEEAWLYLAAIASPRASIYYLERALQVNPDSLRARKGLQWAQDRLDRAQAVKPSGGVTHPTLVPAQALSSPSGSQLSKLPAGYRWLIGIRRFSSHWQNLMGLSLVFLFIITAVTATWISPQDSKSPGPFKQVSGFRVGDTAPHPPAAGYPLGTLPGELDVLHALVWGSRDALSFGLQVALLAFLFGTFFGVIAGYAGGIVSSVMMRVTDSFLAFPVFAGVVFLNQLWNAANTAVGGFYDPYHNIWFLPGGSLEYPIQKLLALVNPLILILVLFSWMPYARLTNSVVASIKQFEFIEAARAIGARPSRIIFRHLLPNSLAPSQVLAARDVGAMVILQATFTFIGLDFSSTWGTMLVMGKDWILGPKGGILTYWWVYVPATIALLLFGIGWNLFGDGLSEALDPREI